MKRFWTFKLTREQDATQFVRRYGKPIDAVTQEAFEGKKSFSEANITEQLKASTVVGMVYAGDRLEGFCFLYIPSFRLNGKTFIWIDKIAITSAVQGGKLGTKGLIRDLRVFLPNVQIGFLGCFTQSPALINSFSSAEFGQTTSPTNVSYASEGGIQVWTFLLCHIAQVQTQLQKSNNLDTDLYSPIGLFRGMYGGNIGPSVTIMSNYVVGLRQLGFDPDRGDAISLVTEF